MVSKSDDKKNEHIPYRNFRKEDPTSAPKGSQGKRKIDWGNLAHFIDFVTVFQSTYVPVCLIRLIFFNQSCNQVSYAKSTPQREIFCFISKMVAISSPASIPFHHVPLT